MGKEPSDEGEVDEAGNISGTNDGRSVTQRGPDVRSDKIAPRHGEHPERSKPKPGEEPPRVTPPVG